MRTGLLLPALLITHAMVAQEAWRSMLCVDPDMANSYFILDQSKCQQLNVARVDVDLILHELQPDNSYTTNILQSITILPADRYGNLNMHLVPERDPGDIASYRVQATDVNGNIVAAFDRTDGSHPREELCRHTCVSNSYAWALVVLENWQQSNVIIEIRDATNGNDPYYFYITDNDMWSPGGFEQQFNPSEFCLTDGNTWSQLALKEEQIEFIDVGDVSGRTNYLGNVYSPGSGEGYGIRKTKGPWCGLVGSTAEMAGTDICTDPSNTALMDHFNLDPTIQFAMAQLDLDPLSCEAALLSGGGPGWNEWGSGGTGQCTAFGNSDGSEDVDGDGVIDPVGWVSYQIDCPTTTPAIYQAGLTAVSDIQINQWCTATPQRLLNIHIPDQNDPKLVPVPRTQLDPGLYEYVVVFDDGTIWRKFQSYYHPVVISANFASFTDVLVYPVPVDGNSFSVDVETLAPLDADITVINNQGTVYYQKSDNFAIPGRNKHVVTMQNPWPSGIYHVLIGYSDGSTDSINITVQ